MFKVNPQFYELNNNKVKRHLKLTKSENFHKFK